MTRTYIPQLPTITDPNLFLVEFASGPDSLGRRAFFAYWLDSNVGPHCAQVGTRGQVFHTWPDTFVKRAEGRGMFVEFLND